MEDEIILSDGDQFMADSLAMSILRSIHNQGIDPSVGYVACLKVLAALKDGVKIYAN